MVDIEIFLIFGEAQISFLSIPRSDVERLAVSPFRWIRYVMFTICGARGELSTTPSGPHVDYDKTEFTDAENTYYYRPTEDCAFVDRQGLNDRLTCTEQITRCHESDIMRRDRHCVVTQETQETCDAVHLIPGSKGDEYIEKVIQLRSPGDDSTPPSNIGIDDIVNGMLLRKDLHAKLGVGQVAFIKTPNYGLRPKDIKRFQRGSSRPDYITLHWLKKPESYDSTLLAALQTLQNGGVGPGVALALGANVDALFQGDGGSLPSTVILDYVYGVAAYESWHIKGDDVSDIMNQYRKKHYTHIPPLPRAPPDDTELWNRYTSTSRDESKLAKAMDELNMVLMYIHGITPEEAAERRQKEIEQEERAAQEASRRKVMEWRKHMDVS